MRLRRLALPVAALLGAAVAVAPGIASGDPPSTASFVAIDNAWQANGGVGNVATIAQGGTVTFSYPSGVTRHNADFGTGSQPTSCTQTAGANSGPVPPLPNQPTTEGWSGTCTFNTPGTYTFHCDLHTYMTATITVQAPGGTTGTTTTTTTATTTTSSTPTTTTATTTYTSPPPPTEPNVPIGPPLAGSSSSAVSVPSHQHGGTVHGSVKVSSAGAGGRLEVDLLARRHRVGRMVRTHISSGTVRFSVPIDAAAKRALRRHGRLILTVEISVRSPRGATANVVRRVRLISSA